MEKIVSDFTALGLPTGYDRETLALCPFINGPYDCQQKGDSVTFEVSSKLTLDDLAALASLSDRYSGTIEALEPNGYFLNNLVTLKAKD